MQDSEINSIYTMQTLSNVKHSRARLIANSLKSSSILDMKDLTKYLIELAKRKKKSLVSKGQTLTEIVCWRVKIFRILFFEFWIIGTLFKFSFCDKFILVCFGWGPDFDRVDFGNHTVISRQPISSKHCLEIKCRLWFDIS